MGRANAAAMLLNTADGISTTLVPPLLGSRDFPIESIGILVSVQGAASLLSKISAGRLAERRDLAYWFAGSCALFAAALALYPFTPSAFAFVLVRIVHGITLGTAITLNFASFLEAATGRNRIRATSLYSTSLSAGYAMGNIFSGLVADHFGYGAAFLLAAACAGIATLMRPQVQIEKPGARARQAQGLSLLTALRRPDILAIPILGLCIGLMHTSQGTLFPLYALAIGQSLTLVGAARGMQSLATTAIRPFGAPLLRILRVSSLASLGLIGTALCIMSVPMTQSAVLIMIAYFVMGGFRGFSVVANTLQAAEVSQRGVLARGTVSSLYSIGLDIAQLVSPALSGLIAGRFGIGSALQIVPVGTVAIGTTAMYMAGRFESSQARRSSPPQPARQDRGESN